MYCILVAGVPAAGKGAHGPGALPAAGAALLSKDAIKEKLYDTVGFRSREEKVALGEGAWRRCTTPRASCCKRACLHPGEQL